MVLGKFVAADEVAGSVPGKRLACPPGGLNGKSGRFCLRENKGEGIPMEFATWKTAVFLMII